MGPGVSRATLNADESDVGRSEALLHAEKGKNEAISSVAGIRECLIYSKRVVLCL